MSDADRQTAEAVPETNERNPMKDPTDPLNVAQAQPVRHESPRETITVADMSKSELVAEVRRLRANVDAALELKASQGTLHCECCEFTGIDEVEMTRVLLAGLDDPLVDV